MKNKLIIVAGSSGSGKSTVSKTILENFKPGQAQIICIDRFYLKDKTKLPRVDSTGAINYDHPESFDWEMMGKCLESLLNNKPSKLPVYNYLVQAREKKLEIVKPTKIVILEGVLPLWNKDINSLASLKIFVDTPLDECFIRRLLRDQEQRGRSVGSIIKQWQETVRPMYLQYAEPTKRCADIVLPWEKVNISGLDVLTSALRKYCK